MDIAKAGPFVTALAGIAEVLLEGEDPEWAVGGVTATAAFTVAQEWLSAQVEPTDVADWLRAGCWDPNTARKLVDAGLRPNQLLDDKRRAVHWVEASNGQEMSLALAVADGFMSVEAAAEMVARS